MKENFLPTVFWFSVSAVVGSISIPRIFQLEYPFPNFSDLVTFSNLMFACRRSGFTKPGFSILRVFSQNMKWNMVFPFSSLSTWGPHGVASCKLGDSVRKAWSTWHSQSLPRTSKSRSILSVWTWHITVQHSFRHSSRHELIEATSLKCTHRTISNYLELCSNYVAGNVFFSKKWSSVSQDWPCFEGQTRIGEVGCGSRQIEGQAWPDWRTVGDIAHC